MRMGDMRMGDMRMGDMRMPETYYIEPLRWQTGAQRTPRAHFRLFPT